MSLTLLPTRRHHQLASRAPQPSPLFHLAIVDPLFRGHLRRCAHSLTSPTTFRHLRLPYPRCFCPSLNLPTLPGYTLGSIPPPFSVSYRVVPGATPVPSPSRRKSLARPPRRHLQRGSLAVAHKHLLGVPPRPPTATFSLTATMYARRTDLAGSIPPSSSSRPNPALTSERANGADVQSRSCARWPLPLFAQSTPVHRLAMTPLNPTRA
ncbi:hypothetical protein B0H16DRAFT_1860008 [Mycena metata]|uniref:Uncharacterized protein n=1 Tax=Mycena metata TaxID=1033252 RepID=A0AAD7IJ58_9AGAR|nr:hypothetical protein B0H16DRAFT_1860008 [Mycena metata]